VVYYDGAVFIGNSSIKHIGLPQELTL